jgi:Alginate lyase
MDGRFTTPGKAVPTMAPFRASSIGSTSKHHNATKPTDPTDCARATRDRRRTAAMLGAAALAVGLGVGWAGNALATASPATSTMAADTNTGLNPKVAPGGNFNLTKWELQLPTGSNGNPTTIPPAKLKGPTGFQNSYFHTDATDGAMAFWDPENGVHTANSHYSRSELYEMTASGKPANWFPTGTVNTLSATVKGTQVPDHVAVGQIHLGSGGSSKPLLELFYYADGDVKMYIEQSPAGDNELPYSVGKIPLGTKWSYTIGLSGNTISLIFNGGKAKTWQMSSTFKGYGMYFKAGDYDQSTGNSSTVGAKVEFYALNFSHS